jgi:putative RecB family exonuclease
MKLYSYSRLETFKECPLKFKFGYIDKVETEITQGIEAFMGSRVHESLEKLYQDLMFQKEDSLPEVLSFYNSQWKKEWNPGIIVVRKNEGYGEENYRLMGEKFISDYYSRYHPFSQSRTIKLETKYHINLDDNGEYHIHVRIDRLAMSGDNVYEIHDYKTSNSLKTQEEADCDRQLAIYAYGIKKMFPDAKKIALIWHYLAFDKEIRSERNDEQLEALRKEVLSLINNVENCTDFPPKTSALCSWCEFRPICPNFRHLYALEKKAPEEYSKDDGVMLVNSYAEITEKIKELSDEAEALKEKLKEFAESNNVTMIYGSGVKVFVKAYPRLSFPKKDDPERGNFFKALKAVGIWEEIAEPNVYELAKLINSGEIHPEIKSVIEKFAEKGETIYVRVMKKN